MVETREKSFIKTGNSGPKNNFKPQELMCIIAFDKDLTMEIKVCIENANNFADSDFGNLPFVHSSIGESKSRISVDDANIPPATNA